MHAILSFCIYRIGTIAINSRVGFYGALFFAVAYYPLELAVGTYGTDHNDIAFLFYITASFWAWFEYRSSSHKYWLFFIGLFAGCAVLVKWLMGLLIYLIWILTKATDFRNGLLNAKSYIPILVCLGISITVFLPWQLYIFHQYPQEAKYEYSLIAKHFFEPVENHNGNIWFHIDALKLLYGEGDLVPVLILCGLVALFVKTTNRIYRVACLAPIGLVYVFYSIAATKIPSFCVVVSPFVFLGLASLFDFGQEYLESKIKNIINVRLITSGVLLITCFFLLNFSEIEYHHSELMDNNVANNLKEMRVIDKLKLLPDSKYIVFYLGQRLNGHIPIMFYTDYPAYNFIPSKEQFDTVASKGFKVVIIDNRIAPSYIVENKNTILLN